MKTDIGEANAARNRLAAIVASSRDAIISKSIHGIVQTWNAAAERMFGYSAKEIIGRSIRLIIPADRQSEEDDILARVSRGEEVKTFMTWRMRKDGTRFPAAVTVSPIHDDAGRVVGVSKIARDISESVETTERLQESEERFRALADNISQLAWMADHKGDVFWYNKRWYEYTGADFSEMRGWGWTKVHHPDHVDRVVAGIQRCWDSGAPWEDTFPLRGADGQYRWFLSRAEPIFDRNGKIVRWFGSNTDITEQKLNEQKISFLLDEVNHRSKNMISVVQAIARQTANDGDRDFVDRFCLRLQALGASQDAMIKSGRLGADVETLISLQLAHFADILGERIILQGPKVEVTASAAQALGMALHELATNAGKYGALSNERGRVAIAWGLEANGAGEMRFQIEWAESGGPPVEKPSHTGFGAAVIDRMSRLSLNAEVAIEFRREGFVWRLKCLDGRALQA